MQCNAVLLKFNDEEYGTVHVEIHVELGLLKVNDEELGMVHVELGPTQSQ